MEGAEGMEHSWSAEEEKGRRQCRERQTQLIGRLVLAVGQRLLCSPLWSPCMAQSPGRKQAGDSGPGCPGQSFGTRPLLGCFVLGPLVRACGRSPFSLSMWGSGLTLEPDSLKAALKCCINAAGSLQREEPENYKTKMLERQFGVTEKPGKS